MGFVYQTPETVGGTVLIIERIESQNYVAGVSGWAIKAAGDAEFNNLTARGELIVGANPGQHIRVGLDGIGRPVIEMSTGAVDEADPAAIRTSHPSLVGESELAISSPLNVNAPVGSIRPEIDLTSWAGSASLINLWADQIRPNVPLTYEDSWTNIPLAGTWVDFAGARANYFKDASGRVQLRGQVASGAAVLVGNLPAGYRPSQSMEWVMRAVGGVTLCAVQVTNAGAINVTANAAAAQASGIRLDSISFPAQF